MFVRSSDVSGEGRWHVFLCIEARMRGPRWQRVVEQYRAWDWARKQKDAPLLARMAERSFMTWPEQKVIAKLCERGSWEVSSPGVLEFIGNLWEAPLGQTNVAEVAFQRIRAAETEHVDGKRMRPERVWFTPIREQVLSQHFLFQEVDTSSAPRSTAIGRQLFTPTPNENFDCTDFSGKDSTPSWPTFSAQSAHVLHAEMAVMLRAFHRKDSKVAAGAWMSSLLQPGLAVSPPGSKTWFLSLGPVENTAAMLWPCNRAACPGGGAMFAPSPKARLQDIQLAVCDNPSAWRAVEVQWMSPLQLKIDKVTQETYICLYGAGDARTLWECAAEAAFWRLPLNLLQRLALQRGCQEDCATLFQVCRWLVQDVFPGREQKFIMDVLSRQTLGRGGR